MHQHWSVLFYVSEYILLGNDVRHDVHAYSQYIVASITETNNNNRPTKIHHQVAVGRSVVIWSKNGCLATCILVALHWGREARAKGGPKEWLTCFRSYPPLSKVGMRLVVLQLHRISLAYLPANLCISLLLSKNLVFAVSPVLFKILVIICQASCQYRHCPSNINHSASIRMMWYAVEVEFCTLSRVLGYG